MGLAKYFKFNLKNIWILRISWVSGQSLDISFEWCESCLLAVEVILHLGGKIYLLLANSLYCPGINGKTALSSPNNSPYFVLQLWQLQSAAQSLIATRSQHNIYTNCLHPMDSDRICARPAVKRTSWPVSDTESCHFNLSPKCVWFGPWERFRGLFSVASMRRERSGNRKGKIQGECSENNRYNAMNLGGISSFDVW